MKNKDVMLGLHRKHPDIFYGDFCISNISVALVDELT